MTFFDNIINIINLVFVLASLVYIYRIYLRTKRRICTSYIFQSAAFLIMVLFLILGILNEKRIIMMDIGLKLLEVLFFFTLALSYWYLQSCFIEAEKELKYKDKIKESIDFIVKK